MNVEMRVLVVNQRWGYGGGQTVFYYTIKALTDAGFKVVVSTSERPDPQAYEELVGEPLPPNVELKHPSLNVRAFAIYKGILSWLEAYRGDYDVVVATAGFPPSAKRLKAPVVYYMHFPLVLMLDEKWNPGVHNRYSLKSPLSYGIRGFLESLVLWLYVKPYSLLARRCFKELLLKSHKILVNSTFTLRALEYALNNVYKCCNEVLEKTSILYPPLPRMSELLSARNRSKELCVTTLGRFSSEKNYELVLEVAKILKDVRFYIIGGVYGMASRAYYEKIKKRAPSNVIVEANVDNQRKVEILSSCSTYLHAAAGEQFGIAPLEAMVAGATLVVHTFSGTWTDVCLEGKYCYGFNNQEPLEISEKVKEALEKPKTAPLEHIEKFSPHVFMKGVVKAVEEVVHFSRL
ncbi:MAG: glycosyltransferase family 4 protein [Acidilobaceae archaeon]